MAKVCIGNSSCGTSQTGSHRGVPIQFRGRRSHRRRWKSVRAFNRAPQLSGAQLMDLQDSFSDTAR